MNKNDLLSVVITSYNRKEFITDAVDSVLAQSYKNTEIFIIDDCSQDGSVELLKTKYSEIENIIIHKNKKNLGPGESRRIGYDMSKGKYIVFMDDDDYYTNYNFFDKAVNILKEKENLSFVSSSSVIEYVKENKKEEDIMNINGEINGLEYLSSFQQEYMKSNSTFTTIFRRKKLEDANFKEVEMVNDSCIYLRALLTGDAYVLNEISGVYRVHSKNITFNLSTDLVNKNLIEKVKIYKELKKNDLIDNPENWLKRQINLTIKYFQDNNNKRKKVFIMGYLRKNLGDDIFVKMLLEKYPIINFYIRVPNYEYVKEMDNYENLNVIIGEDTDEEIYKMKESSYDAYIYIGGSIFMEGGKVYNLSNKFYDFVKRCKEKDIPFCYISSNYGPYKTEEYFKLSERNFNTCTDICFRDKYSYNLFKNIKNVRYAPDFAFGYSINLQNKIKNSIGISVINLDIREDLKKLSNEYFNLLVKNIERYIENGNKVYLYSFCEHEGDNITLDRLLEYFKDRPQSVVGIKYNGNVDEFMDIYSKMEYMICARFHAMILSCIARTKVFVMSYSKKIDNVISDLELKIPVLHFKDIEENTKIYKKDFNQVEEEKILNIIEESKKQEEVFRKKVMEK